MKQFFYVMLTIVLALSLTSCKGMMAKHQISRLESLVEDVQKDGSQYNSEKWDKVFAEYEDICNKMDEYSSEYTSEQKREIASLHAKFAAACASQGFMGILGGLNDAVDDVIDQASGILDGLFGE